MRVLVTGVNGFAGSHLLEYLIDLGHDVYGTLRSFRSDRANLAHINPAKYGLHLCDITDGTATADLIKTLKPDRIFHLAAQSYVPSSWAAPHATIAANVNGTLNILEAVRRHAPAAWVHVAGSSEEYGRVEPEECPITEEQPLRPLSPYGVSKVAADMLARQYAASYGLKVVVTRAFNHFGERRGYAFAESNWAHQIARIEAGLQSPKISHGNLDAVRDYTDVRDIVRGYVLALEQGKSGEVYNLCSGPNSSPTMGSVLRQLIDLSSCDNIVMYADPRRLRPSDVMRLIGDGTRARVELGWTPTIPFASTLAILLQYWRVVVQRNQGKILERV